MVHIAYNPLTALYLLLAIAAVLVMVAVWVLATDKTSAMEDIPSPLIVPSKSRLLMIAGKYRAKADAVLNGKGRCLEGPESAAHAHLTHIANRFEKLAEGDASEIMQEDQTGRFTL